MAEVASHTPDPWEELERLLQTQDDVSSSPETTSVMCHEADAVKEEKPSALLTHNVYFPTSAPDSLNLVLELLQTEDDASSSAETTSVMCDEADAVNEEELPALSTHNVHFPTSALDSLKPLLELLRRMGIELDFVAGKTFIENIFDVLQKTPNLHKTADFSGLDFEKVLLIFKDPMPKHLLPITANVLAKIGIILARNYNQSEAAVEFCKQAYTHFRNSSQLTPQDLVVLNEVGRTYFSFASWYYGNRDTKNAMNCLDMQEDVYATMKTFQR